MKIWKITAEIASLDTCDEDCIHDDIVDGLVGGGNVHCVNILDHKLLYGGETVENPSPKKRINQTTVVLKPKRKYTRRAKAQVVQGDIPAHERPPANQPNGTTVVQVHEDGTKTENRK